MPQTWKKMENDKGFPFYFNEIDKTRQWDHPKFAEIKQELDDCNYVKYSRYRVAVKFRVLQRTLSMQGVALNTIIGVFERHRLGANESSLCLESYDLEAVLSDIFFATNKQNGTNTDLEAATELMQNFLYNVYDRERQGRIQVSSTKLVLGLLSDWELPQLYNFIFKLCADHNNCVTRLRLQSVLSKLVDIATFLHEDVSYGQHLVNSTIEACFSQSPGLVGISESNFLAWLEEPPQLLCWVAIFHRVRTAELVVHLSKCSSCKITPLMGLRYRCMKCSKYTQCQRCFFMGRTTTSHKLSHSMREFCTEDNSRNLTFTFVKKLCAWLPCPVRSNQENNCVIEPKPLPLKKELSLKPVFSDDLHSSIEPLSSPHAQLQLVIKQLEQQNRELNRILLIGSHNEKEIRQYLEEHKNQVATQIHNLKILKDYLSGEPKTQIQSTPMVGVSKYNRRTDLEMLSPITQEYQSTSNLIPIHSITQVSMPYSVNDISTWVKEQPNGNKIERAVRESPVRELHNNLDDALAKLQQILANNFTLDESLGAIDNDHLKHAVSEVEGMLSSFIDTVESSRASSVQPL